MKKYIILSVLLFIIVGLYVFTLWTKSSRVTFPDPRRVLTKNTANGSLEGVFEAITPCNGIKPSLPQIPLGADCEMTMWQVTFQPDKTYSLSASYGVSQPNTTGIKNGGKKVLMKGTWSLDVETGIINLISLHPNEHVSFRKITDELIHLLDNEKKMMVGNGGWSYTLNKVKSDISLGDSYVVGAPDELVSGVFEGRTPCQDFLLAFTEFSVNFPEGCQRIKWLLTFYLDETTGKLSEYIFGIQDRKESHRGSVRIIRGASSDPEAVIYQLEPNDNRQELSLLQVGDNHLFILDEGMNLLVGTNSLSYTLSKTADSYEQRKSPLDSQQN